MSESRRTGPSDITAGLLADIEQAERDRLPPEQLAALLTRHRAGDDEARRRLQQGLRYIAYRFYQDVRPTVRLAAEDVAGTLFEEFGDCIRRLRENVVTAENVEGYIRGDLMHAVTHYMSECSQRINPKASTNSERKRRGVKPYRGLARQPVGEWRDEVDGAGNETVTADRLNDPPRHGTIMTPAGVPYRSTLYEDDDEPRYFDLLWQVTTSPLEEEFVEYLCRGLDLQEIAGVIGISQRRAIKIKKRLEARAR
jgi:hypothetical protein